MKLPNSDEFAHLSDADRFKAVMKRLVSATPEQIAAAEKRLEEEKAQSAEPSDQGHKQAS